MKTLRILSFSVLAAALFTACSSDAVESTDAKDVASAAAESIVYNVDVKASTLGWYGSKLAYGHQGVIDITSGELTMKGDTLTSGNFTVDMKTVKATDEGGDPEKMAKLAGHLMAEDFFDAEKYPTSKFEITGATKNQDGTYNVSGNMTIKDVTKNISFPATIKVEGDKLTATAEFTINRNDWGVTYGSGVSGAIGDAVISDDIKYNVSLVASK
ncbi:MAG: YceI family protein [Flavobacteriales bacterium]